MKRNLLASLFFAGIIRYFFLNSKYAQIIRNRVEVSTPINSWKRAQEGVFLWNNGINPYSGDLCHESPIFLWTANILINFIPKLVPILFILMDLSTGMLLFKMAKRFVLEMYTKQQKKLSSYAKGTDELHIKFEDIANIPFYVTIAYLFNPYSILNCVGQTTSVCSNFLLAIFLFCLSRRYLFLSCLFLALETQKNIYPFVLIIPAALILSENNVNFIGHVIQVILTYIGLFIGLNVLSFYILNGDWKFVDATYGFIFYHRDLQPNIGLFWYFFTEMFEHFRQLFLYSFQINATILYLCPLTLKLRKQPLFLATVLLALSVIFRSYPCVGDVSFYLSLFPLWKNANKFMANNFIVFCIFLITSALGPTVWYLWLYANSANANFYFGATLAFGSAQIFLLTDLLFAYNKREFCLINGLNCLNKIALE